MREQLLELLTPVVQALGFELWELEFMPRAGGSMLRLYIDRPTGICVDDCAQVSHAVSACLDAADPIAGEYTLEVSSPGMDRILRTPAQFAQFVGASVKLEMREKIAGQRRFLGVLRAVTATDITVDIAGNEIRLMIDAIHKARLAPTH